VKNSCEGCEAVLPHDAEAYVCSYECTFCPVCSTSKKNVCPHCGGELVRRPRREALAEGVETDEGKIGINTRP